MQDQVEMLTQERSHSAPAAPSRIVEVLRKPSVQDEEDRNSLLDSVARDEEDPMPPGEGRRLQGFETALTWATYAAVVAVAVLLTWSVGAAVMEYLRR